MGHSTFCFSNQGQGFFVVYKFAACCPADFMKILSQYEGSLFQHSLSFRSPFVLPYLLENMEIGN